MLNHLNFNFSTSLLISVSIYIQNNLPFVMSIVLTTLCINYIYSLWFLQPKQIFSKFSLAVTMLSNNLLGAKCSATIEISKQSESIIYSSYNGHITLFIVKYSYHTFCFDIILISVSTNYLF